MLSAQNKGASHITKSVGHFFLPVITTASQPTRELHWYVLECSMFIYCAFQVISIGQVLVTFFATSEPPARTIQLVGCQQEADSEL